MFWSCMVVLVLVFLGAVGWKAYRPAACVKHGELKDSVVAIIDVSSKFLFDVVVKVFRVCL